MSFQVSLKTTMPGSRPGFDGETILTVKTVHEGEASDFSSNSDVESSDDSASDVETIEPEKKSRRNRRQPRIRMRLRSADEETATSGSDGKHTKERWTPNTSGNTRPVQSHPVTDPWAQPPAPSNHSHSLPGSVLNTISFMSPQDRITLLNELSTGPTLTGEEKASFLPSLAMTVPDLTTIILSRKGTELVVGPKYARESDIAAFVAKELEGRQWAIQHKTLGEIYQLMSASGPMDGDTVHEKHRWVIVPSKLKLLAYKYGHQGLTEEDRQKEIKVMRDVAIRFLAQGATKIDPDCACKAKYKGSNDFSACRAQVEYTVKTCVDLAFAGEPIPADLPWNRLTCGQVKEETLEETFEKVVELDLQKWELSDEEETAIE